MSWIKPVILFVMLGCGAKQHDEHISTSNKYIIEAEELAKIIAHDSIVVLDLRKPQEYSKSHLPKAINLWRAEIQNPKYPFEGMLANQEQLENVLGDKGISSDQFLVLYDDRGACEAARLWWVFQSYGFSRIAILNGGLNAWKDVGSLITSEVHLAPATFRLPGIVNSNSNIGIGLDQLARNYTTFKLLDTRTYEEYSGKMLKKGAYAQGRIPGSLHLDWINAIDEESGKFKSADELSVIYAEVLDDSAIVTYCHSGVRSAHTYFVLTELLGQKGVRNFDGSWVEWTYHQLPIERDSLVTQ